MRLNSFAFLFAGLLLFSACSDAAETPAPTDGVGVDGLLTDTGAVPIDTGGTVDTAPVDAPALPDTSVTTPETASPSDVTVKTGPHLVVVPESHSFSYISPHPEPLFKQVSIMNVGAEPLTLTSIGFPAGSSKDYDIVLIPPLPKTIGPNGSTMVNVRFRELVGGDGTLRIESDDPERPVVDVPLSSHIKAVLPGPCGGLSPTQLNFGTVVRGQKKTLGAVLTNCSETQDLTILKIERSVSFFFALTEEFQIEAEPATPFVIPAGQSFPIDVSYAPKLAGPDGGYFAFTTDDPNEPILQLDVKGLGVEPPPEEIGLTIKLYWDADSCDVDSHLLAPGGSFFHCDLDCHFGNPSPEWGTPGDWSDDPFLDVDDVDGFGPEHTNISEPVPGATYRFIVHYYDDTYSFSNATPTNATVEVLSYGVPIATFGPVNLDSTNRTWDVFDLEWIGPGTPPVITELGNTYMVPQSAIKACMPLFP